MTKSKKMLLLLGVLALLIALYLVVTSLGDGREQPDSNLSELEQPSTQSHTFFTLNASDLTAFSFTNAGEEYAFTLSADKTRWEWEGDPTLPISNARMTLMINAVLELTSTYKYEDVSADKLGEYGLDDSATRLTFALTDGSQTGLLIGKTNAFNYMSYCALSSDPSTVYMISAGIAPYFATTPENLIEDDKLPSYTKTQLMGFRLQLGEPSWMYVYEHPTDDTAAAEDKVLVLYAEEQNVPLSQEESDALVETIMGWNLNDALTFDPARYAEFGVESGSDRMLAVHYTYTKTYEDATTGTTNSTELQTVYTLYLGNTTEDGLTCVRLSDKTGVYALDLSAVMALAN